MIYFMRIIYYLLHWTVFRNMALFFKCFFYSWGIRKHTCTPYCLSLQQSMVEGLKRLESSVFDISWNSSLYLSSFLPKQSVQLYLPIRQNKVTCFQTKVDNLTTLYKLSASLNLFVMSCPEQSCMKQRKNLASTRVGQWRKSQGKLCFMWLWPKHYFLELYYTGVAKYESYILNLL